MENAPLPVMDGCTDAEQRLVADLSKAMSYSLADAAMLSDASAERFIQLGIRALLLSVAANQYAARRYAASLTKEQVVEMLRAQLDHSEQALS